MLFFSFIVQQYFVEVQLKAPINLTIQMCVYACIDQSVTYAYHSYVLTLNPHADSLGFGLKSSSVS